jgi:hypothetical protein
MSNIQIGLDDNFQNFQSVYAGQQGYSKNATAKTDINDIIERNIDAFILYKENVPFLKGGVAASYVF